MQELYTYTSSSAGFINNPILYKQSEEYLLMECQNIIFLLYDLGVGREYSVRSQNINLHLKNRINMIFTIGIAWWYYRQTYTK